MFNSFKCLRKESKNWRLKLKVISRNYIKDLVNLDSDLFKKMLWCLIIIVIMI